MIQVLALCAALLAPEWSGLDPHGRSLHLKLNEDFTISHKACIATVKQANKYQIDPFISAALMYKLTKFSPKLAKKSPHFRKIRENFGCEGDSGRFIKSSCSAFMLFAPRMEELLIKHMIEEGKGSDYRKALREFLGGNKKNAKIVENMARRFADVYTRSHPSVVWNNPFKGLRTPEEEYRHQPSHIPHEPPYFDPYRHHYPAYGGNNHGNFDSNPHEYMNWGCSMLSQVLGPDVIVRSDYNSRNSPPQINFYINTTYADLKRRLWIVNGDTSYRYGQNYRSKELEERGNGFFKLKLNSSRGNMTLEFVPHGNTYKVRLWQR
jgi:hypothetical protein